MTTENIPKYILDACNIIALECPEYGTYKGALGNCVKASDKLMMLCDDLNSGELTDCFLTGDNRPHHWVLFENKFNVDLTARQFDISEPFPKIWITANK